MHAPHARLHRTILRYARRHCSPLTSGIAHALVHDARSDSDVLAAWWVAMKFEENDCSLDAEDVVRLFPACTAFQLLAAEERLLQRRRFCIPRNTRARQIFESFADACEASRWVHALLVCGVLDVYTPTEWIAILGAFRTGTVHPLLLALRQMRCHRHCRDAFGAPVRALKHGVWTTARDLQQAV